MALVAVALVLPLTRYPLLGLVVKKDMQVRIVHSQTGRPISEAEVSAVGKTQKTDAEGRATLKGVRVGKARVTITKKYYRATTINAFVGLGSVKIAESKLVAEGRPIKITVNNTITKKAVKGIRLKAGDSEAKTDDNGQTVLVVQPGLQEVSVEASGQGFNTVTTTIDLQGSNAEKEYVFSITPAGKIYFLSRLSGKIDVVKTNLDGSSRQTVLAGTGFEQQSDTILLASRDWKYLALKSKREKDKPAKLYVIDTSQNDKLITADEGNAEFTLHGWLKHYLIYQVDRTDVSYQHTDKFRLKSYNADIQKLITLDKTDAWEMGPGFYDGNYYWQRYSYQEFSGISITENNVIYAKVAFGVADDFGMGGIYSINPDGSQKKTLTEVKSSEDQFLGGFYTYKPGEVYYYVSKNPKAVYYEVEDGGSPKEIPQEDYEQGSNNYITFLVSPEGNESLWAESRDGKNVLFIGSIDLENGKEITRLTELYPYGWYTDDYILLSKNGSELFIMPREGGEPLKVTDYHKPSYDYRGYGYGYGGN